MRELIITAFVACALVACGRPDLPGPTDKEADTAQDTGAVAAVQHVTDEESQPGITSIASVEEFDRRAIGGPLPVMVFFHSRDCAACAAMKPIVTEVAQAYTGRVFSAGVDLMEDAVAPLGPRYNVLSVPTFVFIRDGREVNRVVGRPTADKLQYFIDKKLLDVR